MLIWEMLNHSNCLLIRAVFFNGIATLIHYLVGVQLYYHEFNLYPTGIGNISIFFFFLYIPIEGDT